MENGENSRSLTTDVCEPTRPYLSRRTILGLAGVVGVATPVAMVGAATARHGTASASVRTSVLENLQ